MKLALSPFLLIFLFCLALGVSRAQDEKRPFFLGINPSITVEPYYEKGELDVNIVPLVFQKPLSDHLDFRATSILNLGVRKTASGISHFGIELGLPVFFKAKESKTAPSSGFYLTPLVSLTRNEMAVHNNLGLWAEPGYHLLFDNKFAMSFGLQVGSTYFMYNLAPDEWKGHFGVKVVFGKWFGA